jgi:hypothetical protein
MPSARLSMIARSLLHGLSSAARSASVAIAGVVSVIDGLP